MGIMLSPGVYSKETDISNIIPNIASTSAALVGYSAKGDTDVRLITNSKQFIDEYGEPDPTSGSYFHYSALAYLENGNVLYCKRVHNGAKYGGLLIGKDGINSVALDIGLASAEFDRDITIAAWNSTEDIDDYAFLITGKDPGIWNNNISIKIKDVLDNSASVEITDQYTFVIEVYYTDDAGITSLVESWKVSRKRKLDGYGKQLYLEDKINDYSSYIKVWDNEIANSGESDETGLADTILPNEESTAISLAGGSVGTTPAADPTTMQSQIIGATGQGTGWYAFENPDDYDVRLLIEADDGNSVIQTAMIAIAESRKDCLAILNVPFASTSALNAVTYRNTTLNANTSYAALYTGWPKIFDTYNSKLVNVPPSGYVASQCAYNDYAANVWSAPAGFNRGSLNILGVNVVYTQGERDVLYPAGINPIQTFKGEGNVIWGQKTLQKKASALDRINVRRMLIIIEKAIAIALRSFVFESNNEDTTRFKIRATINEYLDKLRAQGAFQTDLGDNGYLVVCDTTNNTPAVIDANELHVDVFIKPIRVAEFIELNTVITNTGVVFNELIARGVNL